MTAHKTLRSKHRYACRLLAGLVLPIVPAPTSANTSAQPVPDPSEAIIVYGFRDMRSPIGGLRADSELDENGIAAYGADTVGDLLGIVSSDSSGEGPVVLINGQPASGIDDIADLPTEVVSKIQLLSRNAAGVLGERPTRRVINVVIRPDHRQITTNLKGRRATNGKGRQGEGEVNLLKLHKNNRRSLVLRAVATDPLYETDRSIASDPNALPFATGGNVLSYPLTGGEIDPALSALLGDEVTLAGVPIGNSNPTLAVFAGLAGNPNVTDVGRFRTLLPKSLNASANGNVTQKFGLHTLSFTLRGERLESHSRTGAATASLRLPATSPFSPFSQDVTLAEILDGPQKQKAEITSLTGAVVANGPLGRWRYTANANLTYRSTSTVSQSGFHLGALQAGLDDGSINPFVPLDRPIIGPVLAQRARGHSTSGGAQANFMGSPFSLPAGPARAAIRLDWHLSHGYSSTSGSSAVPVRRTRRDEAIAQLNLQLPIVDSKKLGGFGAELSGALHHVTAAGWLRDYGYGLDWDPNARLSFRAALNQEQVAPPPNALTDPIVTLDNVRTFDFIRQETVFVTYLTGGNPDLKVARRRTTSLGASWHPLETADLDITADYNFVRDRNAFASLPPVNAAVQAAFTDRFQRDSTGRLIAVDARPVPFDRVDREELRLGAIFSRNFGHSPTPAATAGATSAADILNVDWRVSAYANDIWTIKSTRLARPGLPVINLLTGGAFGYGGGQPRHRVQFGGGILHRGVGIQFDGNWIAGSRIAAGTLAAPDVLRFSPRTLVDARLFANLGPLLPHQAWAKGMRLSLGAENLLDSKIRVRNNAGVTPIGYQPFLLDPLGRTITIGLRKVF